MGALRPAALLLALLLAVTACSGRSKETPPLTAQQVMERTQASMSGLKSFRFALASQGGDTPLPGGFALKTAEGSVVSPNSLDMTAKATFAGFLVEVRVINADGKSFMSNPLTGGWQPFEPGQSPVAFFSPSEGVNAVLSDIQELQLVGEAEVSGVGAHHLRGKVPAASLRHLVGSAQEGSVLAVELWTKKDSFHLLQARLDGLIVPGEPPGLVRVLTLSAFDEPVSISAPV